MTTTAMDNNSAFRAAAYLRMSSADPKQSLRQQLRQINHHIKSLCPHVRLIGAYSDNSKSCS